MTEKKQKPTKKDLEMLGQVQENLGEVQRQARVWLSQAVKDEMRARGFNSTSQVEALTNEEINGEGGFIDSVESRYRDIISSSDLTREIPNELAKTKIGGRVELNKMLRQFGAEERVSKKPRQQE
ncbi:MAG: hypothetical protein OEX81_00475 [Candidatus Pacebacteria bacterium]|nr:hypothetical protein [Candidatus Paceibacterota bacterium]